MIKGKTNDTIDIMTNEDTQTFAKISAVKKGLMTFIKPEEIVVKIVELIEASTSFNMSSLAKKTIDYRRPVFNFTYDPKTIVNTAKKNKPYEFRYKGGEVKATDKKYSKDIEMVVNNVYRQIIVPFSNHIIDKIKDDEKFIDLLMNLGIIEDRDVDLKEVNDVVFTLSNIFGSSVSLERNQIAFEYVVKYED